MTVGEIERRTRTLVNDTESPYRFESKDVQEFALTAVRHLRNINPGERYGEDGRLDDTLPDLASMTDEAAADAEVRVHPRHEEAVVKYVAHLVYQLDMTDSVNMQIAEALRTRAEALMQL